MMAFNNPIGTQTQAGAAVAAPVQNTSAQQAVSGLADMVTFWQNRQQADAQATAAIAPDAWQVKEEWETEGSQKAIEIAKQYQLKRKTEGAVRAEAWLNKTTLEIQSTLGATQADKFRSTLTDTVGKNSDVANRNAEIDAANELAKARQAKLDDLELTGRQLIAANAAKYGLDPSKVSADQAIGIAMVTAGQQQSAALESAQNAIIIQQNGMVDRDRKLRSQAGAVTHSSLITNNIRTGTATVLAAIRQNPNNAEQIKAAFIADMELQKGQIVNTLAKGVSDSGGNYADVDNSIATGLQNQYDAVIQLVRGDLNNAQMEKTLEALSLGTTLNAVAKLDSKLSQNLLISNAVRLPMDITAQAVKTTVSTYNPATYAEVIGNLSGLGAAAARQQTNVPPEKAYSLVYDAAVLAKKNPELVNEAGESIVSTFLNSFNSTSKVRGDANSAKGLPVLLDKMSRDPDLKTLAPVIQKAAEAEGVTVDEMFTRSMSTMFRESIYPSLSIEDPYVVPNLDIQYQGGKFTVKLKEDAYRKAAKLERNVLPHSGRDLSADRISVINQRLMRVQQVLNSGVLSYQNIGGNPDDLGAALKYQLEVSAGISNLQVQE